MNDINDLMLTASGDLMFLSKTRKNNKIQLQFVFTQNHAIKIDFSLDYFKAIERRPNQILLSFDVGESIYEAQQAKVINKLRGVSQACYIRLKTTLGELPYRETIGSNLEKTKHDFLFDPIVKNKVLEYAKLAIQDILPNAEIKLTASAKHTPNGYQQVMKISIYDEEVLILEYQLEE